MTFTESSVTVSLNLFSEVGHNYVIALFKLVLIAISKNVIFSPKSMRYNVYMNACDMRDTEPCTRTLPYVVSRDTPTLLCIGIIL